MNGWPVPLFILVYWRTDDVKRIWILVFALNKSFCNARVKDRYSARPVRFGYLRVDGDVDILILVNFDVRRPDERISFGYPQSSRGLQ